MRVTATYFIWSFVCLSLLCTSLAAQSDFTLRVVYSFDNLQIIPSKAERIEDKVVEQLVFQSLTDFYNEDITLFPILATKPPKIENVRSGRYKGGLAISYEIREEAKWDDGQPITALDYLFTLKAIHNPYVEVPSALHHAVDFVKGIELDETNPNRFTIYTKDAHYLARYKTNIRILPAHFYDRKKLLSGISFEALSSKPQQLDQQKLKEFATIFNRLGGSKGTISGSGAYSVETVSRDSLVLKRKTQWWAQELHEKALQNYPKRIVLYNVKDDASMMNYLNQGIIDLWTHLPFELYKKLRKESDFNSQYEIKEVAGTHTRAVFFNIEDPILKDHAVRQAIHKVVEPHYLIQKLYQGAAHPTASIFLPSKNYYLNDLEVPAFEPQEAEALLDKAGWVDSDNDGIRDKKIKGEVVPLELKFQYDKGNAVRKAIGLHLKLRLAGLGIELKLEPLPWKTLLKRASNGQVQLFSYGITHSILPDEPSAKWHSREAVSAGGDNHTNFSDQTCDRLMDELEQTFDNEKRKQLYFRIQKRISTQFLVLPICVPKQFIVVRKGIILPTKDPFLLDFNLHKIQK